MFGETDDEDDIIAPCRHDHEAVMSLGAASNEEEQSTVGRHR